MAQLIGNAVTGTSVGETVTLPITHQTLLSSDGMVITLQSDDKLITTTGLQKLQRQTFTVPEVSTEPEHPPLKRIKKEVDPDISITDSQSVKQILFNINKAICLRLDSIENKLETISTKTQQLEEKVDHVSNQLKEGSLNALSNSTLRAGKSGAVIVGVPHDRDDSLDGDSDGGVQNLGPNVTLITLNSEEDFPHGCWLGDESNPEMRVRAPITPSDLLHIHSNCRTAEKMALTLLDYLFDRETQANSNLSGMGKHGKRQLDPLMIYGVRCHLIHRFGVTEQDWHRIKQNVDSKCRTAFRRKTRGLPLMVKAFRGKAPPTYAYVSQNIHGHAFQMQEIGSADDLQNLEDGQLHIHERRSLLNLPSVEQTSDVDLSPGSSVINASEILQNAGGGEIQVLHATPEQVAQLQQTHQIQILQGGQLVGSDDVQVSMAGGMVDGVNIVQIRPEDVCEDEDEDPPSDTAEQ